MSGTSLATGGVISNVGTTVGADWTTDEKKQIRSALGVNGTKISVVDSEILTGVVAVPSDVWDEILTGATHNIATSAGRRVREIGAYAIESGTAQGGNSHSITLAATASATDGIYNRNLLVITDNTGVGQTRTIVDYNGTTKVAVADRNWYIQPDATSDYQITPDDTPLVVDHGVARGGTATTITLRLTASAIDDTYNHGIITILAGTGQGQIRLLHEYDGTTKIATICGDGWTTTPDTTSVYVVMPYGITSIGCISPDAVADIADGVWDEDLTGHSIAKSAGWFVKKIKSIGDTILAFVT